jgi:small subunit ribosomal protein S9
MLSACTRTVTTTMRRNIVQPSRCNTSGFQDSKRLFTEIPYLIQPLLCFFKFNTTDIAVRNTSQSTRVFSTAPPQPPPTGGNFRRGGDSNFRLRLPNSRGGGNFGGRGGEGRGGGGGNFGRGRGRGGGGLDEDGRAKNRDFGLGGGNYGEGGGRNSPPTLNKKNIYGNPEPFISAEKGTRTNAVTVFPGNYIDDDEGYSDDEYGVFGDGDKNDDASITGTTTLYDPSFVPDDPAEIAHQKALKEHLLKEQEKREKWIDNALPPERAPTIDERGRAYGRGGRKRAQARVWIQPGLGEVVVNRRRFTDYFDRLYDREQVLAPFVATETCNMFDVQIMVKGGGLTGQAGAIRLGAARALNAYNPDLYRPPLKFLGYLTRDPRKVERKKIGHTKARKSPQWVRR